MRNFRGFALALTLLVVVLGAAGAGAVTSPRSAAAATDTTVCRTKWAGFGNFQVCAGVRYDGRSVRVTWGPDCRRTWGGLGTDVQVTWCGVYYGNGFVEVGANYNVRYYAPNGWQYWSWGSYIRIRIYPSGSVSVYGSAV